MGAWMTKLFGRESKPVRVWGQNDDGSPYVVGMTVGELRAAIKDADDKAEVCVAVCPKKYWNGGGYLGKLKAVVYDGHEQIWLKALVLDVSLEIDF